MIVQDPLDAIAMLLVKNSIRYSSHSSYMKKKREEKKEFFSSTIKTEISSTRINNHHNDRHDENDHKVATSLIKMMPIRTKKKVSFCYLVDVIETLHHRNYTKEEMLKSWYSKSDYKRMEEEFEEESRSIGKLLDLIVDDCCGR